jgi:hypothetical protein
MAMRGGWTINGKHFRETHSSGLVRYTHRFFIDGKLVTKNEFFRQFADARKADEAKRLQAIVA